jgi:hypothetical protein
MDGKEFLDLLGGIISLKERGSLWPDTGAYAARGMHHNSTALNFYGASKKSLHKPRATSGNTGCDREIRPINNFSVKMR